MSNKFCIVTQQRTGSTLCLRLIEEHFQNKGIACLNLGEFWEDHNVRALLNKVGNQWHVSDLRIPGHFLSVSDYNLGSLMQIDQNTAVCFKIFAGGNTLHKDHLVAQCANLGFTFILLERNDIEHMFMSQVLAELTGNWGLSEYNKICIDVDSALAVFTRRKKALTDYRDFIERNKDNLSSAKLIKYETIFNDMGDLLGTTITKNTRTKQSKKDHYDYVENSKEIRELLSAYLKGSGLINNPIQPDHAL